MKYIKITLFFLIITLITINAQPMSIFLKANKSGWYPVFLNPVVSAVTSNGTAMKVLDIGTGPGKLPELLSLKDSTLNITGIDIDTAYICSLPLF